MDTTTWTPVRTEIIDIDGFYENLHINVTYSLDLSAAINKNKRTPTFEWEKVDVELIDVKVCINKQQISILQQLNDDNYNLICNTLLKQLYQFPS